MSHEIAHFVDERSERAQISTSANDLKILALRIKLRWLQMDSLGENFSNIVPNKQGKAHPRQNNYSIIISLWKIFRF